MRKDNNMLVGLGVLLAVGGLIFFSSRQGGNYSPSSGGFVKGTTGKRGIDNNNPGNIIKSDTAYVNKVPLYLNTDTRFEQFYDYVSGVRAMIVLIDHRYRQGYNTLRKLITKWAPPVENNTEAYIRAMENYTRLRADEAFSANKDIMKRIITGIIRHENGISYLTDSQFDQAYAAAKNSRLAFLGRILS